MSDSVYAPPKADIQVAEHGDTEFYVVAPRKFFLLSVLTMDLYFVYWFYQNWLRVKEHSNADVWPAMRGLFYIFFTHSLFKRVNDKIESDDKSYEWNPSTVATLIVVLAIISGLIGAMTSDELNASGAELITIAITLISPVILLKAQGAINVASGDPDGSTNAKLTVANWLWMLLGGFLWFFYLLGLYVIAVEGV